MTVITAGKPILPKLCHHFMPQNAQTRGLWLFFSQLFAGQERGRVRYVAGKTHTGNSKWELGMKNKCGRRFEKGNKRCKTYVHPQMSACNI